MFKNLLASSYEHLPNGDRGELSDFLDATEVYFLWIFIVEMIVKIMALGFCMHKNSYMTNGWNIMDFVVVSTGILDMYGLALFNLLGLDPSLLSKMKLLKMGRVFRPLKMISNSPSLQVVMSAILKALGPIFNIFILLVFFIVVFAIVGVEFYAGGYHSHCVRTRGMHLFFLDASFPVKTGYFQFSCEIDEIGPFDGIVNFDDVLFGMLTVFQILTLESWTGILYLSNDGTTNGNALNSVIFVLMVVIGALFMLNLVIGVLSGEFSKERERVEKRNAYLAMREDKEVNSAMNGYLRWIQEGEAILKAEEEAEILQTRLSIKAKRRATTLPAGFSIPGEGRKMGSRIKIVIRNLCEICDANFKFLKFRPFFRAQIRGLVRTQFWFWLILSLVLLNTLLRCSIHHNMAAWYANLLSKLEITFLVFFTIELLLKWFGLGSEVYFQSYFNIFDLIVIALSWLDYVIKIFFVEFSLGISILRALRLLKAFKVTPVWKDLSNLVVSLMSSVKSILALIFLLFLMLMVFALLGMQLFGGQSNFPDGIPNQNFDRFFPAFLTVFQVLTGEDWVSIMHTSINGMGGVDGGGFIYSVYYVIVTLIGNFVLLNVFLAIAVDNLANAAELSVDEGEVEEARKSMINRELDPIVVQNDTNEGDAAESVPPLIDDSSLFIFEKTNPIRVACSKVNSSPLFVNFILVIIGLSSLALAADDPIAKNEELVAVLYYADLVFTCVFIFETIVKIIALGFILHPGSFMRSIWNVLDIIVVVGAILGLVLVDGSDLGFIKTLRVFRVLRPLKSVQRLPKLKAVFNGFITSIVNVLLEWNFSVENSSFALTRQK
ncbi:unnamed protein product [Oikopleura dioica]|uniref:Ion transport domain-containing protein n=1 Tax=Oikopleura dioica TaxID=34765 RepID=E4XB67_OIKDI|nr:unnamed protein product [Oikopleura dioica]